MTNYAMQSSVHARHIEARTWTTPDGESAILTFSSGILSGNLSMHIPPSVADATAAAFNEAMRAHEAAQIDDSATQAAAE